jgi:hypothetical protein
VVQRSPFRVEKAQTAYIKAILYSSWLGSRFTQLVIAGIPGFNQYCEQFLSVVNFEP